MSKKPEKVEDPVATMQKLVRLLERGMDGVAQFADMHDIIVPEVKVQVGLVEVTLTARRLKRSR